MLEMSSSRRPTVKMRETTHLENYYIFRNKLELSSCVSVSASYSLPVFGNKKLVFKVLAEIIRENPALRSNYTCIDEGKEKWQLEPVKSIGFDDVVATCPYTELSDDFLEWNHALDKVFEIGTGKALWKLYILNDSTACFTFDHTVMDGMSGMEFHTRFRQTAEKYVNDVIDDINLSSPLYEDESVALTEKELPNAEVLHEFKPSMFTMAKMLWLILVAPKIWGTGYASIPKTLVKSDTKIEVINIDPATLKLIQSGCKKNNVRLVSWIITCLQLVLNDVLPENGNLKGNIPINVRPLIKDIGTPLGLFVCGYTILLKPLSINGEENKPETIIQSAQERSKNIDDVLADNCRYPINMIGLLGVIPSIKNLLEKDSTEDRNTVLECSNLGLFRQPPDSALKVQNMVFSNGDFINGAAYATYCASTEEGGMNICLVFNKEYSLRVKSVKKVFTEALKLIYNN